MAGTTCAGEDHGPKLAEVIQDAVWKVVSTNELAAVGR